MKEVERPSTLVAFGPNDLAEQRPPATSHGAQSGYYATPAHYYAPPMPHQGAPVYSQGNAADAMRSATAGSTFSGGPPTPPTTYYRYAPPAPPHQLQPVLPQGQSLRIPRDYTHGEVRQFALEYPAQLEGTVSFQEFRQFIRRLNLLLTEAEAPLLRHAIDHILEFFTLNLSPLILPSYYHRAMRRVYTYIQEQNTMVFEPAGWRIVDLRDTAFLYLEIVPL
ncbi:hypothetical protein H4R34_000378 [Dimargaris verticillata]|uniref:Ras modification protein ERF4 n=1 Tax=Dimargaris verticillata TaxID=2761393 RepID=A0A9W8B6E9_9FUNG|nr:hypothetical protein H4R34_000378 [Dimargaris verticillata]